jgi:outer membrane protein TolC
MFKKLLIAGTMVSGILMCSLAAAAEDLDQLVQLSLANNPDLAAMKERWQQAAYRPAQVGSLMDPVLSFALSNYPHDSLSSSEFGMTGNEVRLAQAFPFPGKLQSRADLAKEQAKWFEAAYYDKHYQVARMVKDVWYRIYFNTKAVETVERNLSLVDDVVRLTEVRYETGSGLQQDVLKAHIQRSRFMDRLMSLRQQSKSFHAELSQLLNRSELKSYGVPEQLDLVEADQTLDQFINAALENRPMSDAYLSLIRRYKHQKKLAELDSYPDLTLWGGWRFRDNGLADGGTDFVSAGVSFNLPVYQERRRAALAEAEAALRMAENQAEDFRNTTTASIRKAYARMEETRQQAELYGGGIIPQTSQSFQSAMNAYQVGKVAFISLLDALMTTFNAEMEYYRVSSEYMRSLARLEAESTLSLIGSPVKINSEMSEEVTEKSN